MKRDTKLIGLVLWQLCIILITESGYAQHVDSTFVFPSTELGSEPSIIVRRLELGLAVGAGAFTTFDALTPKTLLQPVVGFDFIAIPGRWPQFLFGARLGIANRFSSSFYFGIREPIGIEPFSIDAAFLVFDEERRLDGTGVGGRLGLIAGLNLFGSIRTDIKLSAEYRGIGSPVDVLSPTRQLWWYGMDIGFAFALTNPRRDYTRAEMLRASLYPIASGEELNELRELGDDNLTIEYWLDKFWEKRDPTPETQKNEARIEYERRVEIANTLFSRSGKSGTMTDQGRVLLLYGQPDYEDIDVSATKEQYKYILWVYNGRLRDVGRAVFIFESFGVFEWKLIYSNVPSEYRGPLPANLPAAFRQWM
jgi:GWxTD domain-containing protein